MVVDEMAYAELKEHHTHEQAHEKASEIGVCVASEFQKQVR